ncbi:MAG: M23 family metallopeptidase [Alphaproteobacteria bacterium]|nr:M23 family metallopeptidase [Alphaproteobacteria bacterium]
MRVSLICLMINFLISVKAFAFEVCGDIKQGELLIIHDKTHTYLTAVGRDQTKPLDINGVKFDIQKTKWDIQSVRGVEQKKVTPSKEHEAAILREQKDVKKALNQKANKNSDWQKGFIEPVQGRISGHFGYQRIFNGIKKNPHSGTDIAAPLGTPVKAAADGVIVLAGYDYFYTGNIVIIDHGDGLKTIYAHLQSINVKQGENVKQGHIIGTLGKTGRATGPHLHWGAVLSGTRFRPQSLLDFAQKTCRSY